jgi:hypothetical protein
MQNDQGNFAYILSNKKKSFQACLRGGRSNRFVKSATALRNGLE